MQRENPQVTRTKKWLTDSLIELMAEKPFVKITIQEIVDRAQLSRSAFYSHYNRKEDILYTRVVEIYLSHIERRCKLSHTTQLENYIATAQMYWDNRVLFRLMYQNGLQYIVYNAIMNNYETTVQLVSQTLQTEPEDRDLYYSVFVPYHRRAEVDLALSWISSEHPAPVEEIGVLIYSFCSLPVYQAFRNSFHNCVSANIFQSGTAGGFFSANQSAKVSVK